MTKDNIYRQSGAYQPVLEIIKKLEKDKGKCFFWTEEDYEEYIEEIIEVCQGWIEM